MNNDPLNMTRCSAGKCTINIDSTKFSEAIKKALDQFKKSMKDLPPIEVNIEPKAHKGK